MKINKKILMSFGFLILLFLFMSVLFLRGSPQTGEKENVEIVKYNEDGQLIVYYFWDRNCPVCSVQSEFLKEMEEIYGDEIEIKSFELRIPENIQTFQQIGNAYDMRPSGVPTTFIANRYWVGFSSTYRSEIESKIEICIETVC